jgi:hypothetical protein
MVGSWRELGVIISENAKYQWRRESVVARNVFNVVGGNEANEGVRAA